MKFLKEATRNVLKSYGHNVIFDVKFDWLKNNWINTIEGYEKWLQCYEKKVLYTGTITNSTIISIKDDNANFEDNKFINKYVYILTGTGTGQIAQIKSNSQHEIIFYSPFTSIPSKGSIYEIVDLLPLNDIKGYCKIGADYPNSYYVYYDIYNKGKGKVENVSFKYGGENDIWTLICIDEKSGQFIVKGDINKVKDDAYVGQYYNNGFISFNIKNDEDNPFREGDIIKIYPAISFNINESPSEGIFSYITNSIGVSQGLQVDGGPDFYCWEKVEWIGENIDVYVRTTSDIPDKLNSPWIKVENGQNLENILSPRRYLQFMIKLQNGSKLAQLKFYYDVKSHTNSKSTKTYFEGFNRIKNIRIDRSASPFMTEGYAIADASITISNEDGYFSLDNRESPYYDYLKPDVKVKIRIGIEDEFFDKFVGLIDSYDINANDGTVSLRLKDLGKLLNRKIITDGDISYRSWRQVSLSFLCEIIALDCGFNKGDLQIFNSFMSDYKFDYVNLRGKNAWTVLQQLAQATLSDIYISEEGKLVLKDMFFSKNVLSAPTSLVENGNFVNFVYNEMYNSFIYLAFYKYNTSHLYYYYDKWVLLLQNIYATALYNFDENEVGETISTFWAADRYNLYRIIGDSSNPKFEKRITINGYSFTNLMFSSNISRAEVEDAARVYTEKLFMLLKKENSNNYYLYLYDGRVKDYIKFILGNMGRKSIEENGNLYYSYLLPQSVVSKDTATIFAVYPDGRKEKMIYDDNFPYAEKSWRFRDKTKRDEIIINHEIPSVFYEIIYVPLIPFENVPNVIINIDNKFYFPEFEYMESSLCLSKFIGIINVKRIDNYNDWKHWHGHLFYLVIDDSLKLRTTTPDNFSIDLSNIESNIKYIVGVVFDKYKQTFTILYKNKNDIYKIFWIKCSKNGNNITYITGEETILVDNKEDKNLILYDIEYNETTKTTFICGGYKTKGGKLIAKLFTYSPGVVRCEFENLAGKPLYRVYPKDPYNLDGVEEKDYIFYFQKRGGFRALTSQIWAWTDFIVKEDDKDKCIIKQKKDKAINIPDGITKEFFVPNSLNTDEIQYVYVNGKDIGSVNWIKGTNSIILKYAPAKGDIVEFGEGKRLYKYYGNFVPFELTEAINSNAWNNPNWGIFQIYKPVRLRITFKNCNLVNNILTINGIDLKNADFSITFSFFNDSGILKYRENNGDLKILEKDENGDYFVETSLEIRSVSSIDASSIWKDESSRIQIESIVMDLIKGIIVEIYTSADEKEEQFGGDGTISGYTDKAYIKVIKETGIKEINSFSDELAFHNLFISKKGIIMGTTYPLGKVFFFTYNREEIPLLPDYVLEYDKEITQLSINLSDTTVKNNIVIHAQRKNIEPYRDIDIETGKYIGGNILPEGYTEDEWLWAKLNTAWRNQSPFYLNRGNYIEFNIQFQEPLDNGKQQTNIRFNARFYQVLGRLDENGEFKIGDKESYFPYLFYEEDNKYFPILMAGIKENQSEWETGEWEIDGNKEPVYRVFTPEDDSEYYIPAMYPSRFINNDFDNIPNLKGGILKSNLGNSKFIRIRMDGDARFDFEIDITSRTPADSDKVLAQEIVDAINSRFINAYGCKIAEIKIDYSGSDEKVYIELKSKTRGSNSKIEFLAPSDNWTATSLIFGINNQFSRDAIRTFIGEMEKANCEVFIEDEQHKCDYLAGEYTILEKKKDNKRFYILKLSDYVKERYKGKLVSIYYPMRLDVTRLDIDASYGKGILKEGQGSIKRFYYDEEKLLPRLLKSYDIIGDKYKLTKPVGGFHLNMIWSNTPILESVSYLRLENPTNNPLDANYNPEADPSRLDVWIEKIELRGLRIYDSPIEITSIKDEVSKKLYLEQVLEVNNEFLQEANLASIIGHYLLKKYKDPLEVLNVTILGVPVLELLDIVSIKEKNTGIFYKLFEIVNISENLQENSAYTMSLTLHKISEDRQPKDTLKYLYYSVLKFNKEEIKQ